MTFKNLLILAFMVAIATSCASYQNQPVQLTSEEFPFLQRERANQRH